jgi:hypothetical protein
LRTSASIARSRRSCSAVSAQQEVGQDQQQAEDDEHHPARRPDHEDPARSDRTWPRYSPVSVRRKPAINPISWAVSTRPS